MKWITRFSLGVGLYITVAGAWAIEAVEWKRVPIKVELRVDETRILHFEDHVSVWRPDQINGILKVESLQGSVYLEPTQEFEPTQMKVRFHSTNDIILLDVFATKSKGEPLDEMLIGVPSVRAALDAKLDETGPMATASTEPAQPALPAFLGGEDKSQAEMTPTQVMRYVTHRFYAPKRLQSEDTRIQRVDINPNLELDDLFIGQSAGLFNARPVASWKTNAGLYATAIQLRNKTVVQRKVNPFELNANYLYASTQHLVLSGKNVVGDTTMLYVITDKPFSSALYESPAPSIGAQYGNP